MSSPFTLPSGVTIHNPDELLIEFLKNEWAIYDGQPNAQDSTLSLFDILVSVSMNSRLDTANKVRSIWDSRGVIEQCLRLVPTDISLQDTTIPWDSMQVLFDAFCSIRYAKEAVATKILHRKRPALIPIIDSVIGRYLNEVRGFPLPASMCIGRRIVEQTKLFRELLVSHMGDISELSETAARAGFPITRVRTLEILVWCSNQNRWYQMESTDGTE